MKEIENKIDEIEAIKNKIENFEADPDDYTKEFDEMLDEIHGTFVGYSASYILKQVDPTAYRCGLLDYVDNCYTMPPDEWDTELSDLLQELEDLIDDKVEELESELEELEDSTNTSYKDIMMIDSINSKIEQLQKIREEYL